MPQRTTGGVFLQTPGVLPQLWRARMVDTAAHLVDQVLPAIPIRQWVLSFPYPLRLLYSTHPQAMTDQKSRVDPR